MCRKHLSSVARSVRQILIVCATVCTSVFIVVPSHGQEDLTRHWNGVWNAEGTLFTIGIVVNDNVMKIRQIESLGFEWTNSDGVVEGNIARVEIEYAGISGIIQVELIDANTAVAFAATCTPEFMVVCALAKDRQAVFRRVEPD